MSNRSLGIATISLMCLVMAACGYRFSGAGTLPKGVKRVFVNLFENRTSEVGLENTITNDVISEFVIKQKDRLATQSEADAILKGTIVSLRKDAISRTGAGEVQERRVEVVVNVSLVDPSGKTLWSAQGVSASEAYAATGGIEASTAAGGQGSALSDLSKRIAERIYNRLTEDF